MAKKTQAKTTESTASSWWKERGKIMAMKTESKAVKPKTQKKKNVKTKKAEKTEKGKGYVCEVCGGEIVCVSDSAGNVICCEQPMYLICE